MLTLFESVANPHILLTFGKVQNPLRLPHKTKLRRPKWHEHVGILTRATTACNLSVLIWPDGPGFASSFVRRHKPMEKRNRCDT